MVKWQCHLHPMPLYPLKCCVTIFPQKNRSLKQLPILGVFTLLGFCHSLSSISTFQLGVGLKISMFPEGIELHCKKGVDETRLSTRQSKKNDLRPPDVLDQSTNEKKAADDISVLQRRTLATVFSYEYCQNTIIHTLVLYLVVDNNIVNYPCTI